MACSVAYLDASLASGPREAMHGRKAMSYLNLVLPCYTLVRFQIAAEGECRRYK